MIPLVIIRPEPGCGASLAMARAAGLDAHGFPLFEVRPREWQRVDPDAFDALLVGSVNALRHGGEGLVGLRRLPVLAVGETTARAARDFGFTVARTGSGGLQALLDTIPAGIRLLRLAGEERVALAPPEGVMLVERVTYASEPREMPEGLVARLRQPAVVALHSAVAARHFAAECDRLGVSRAGLRLAALAPRIASVAGAGWAACASAAQADDAALLALARQLCQSLNGEES